MALIALSLLLSQRSLSPTRLIAPPLWGTVTSTRQQLQPKQTLHIDTALTLARITRKSARKAHTVQAAEIYFSYFQRIHKNSSFDSLPVKCAIKSACLMNPDLNVYIVCKHYPSHLLERIIPSFGCSNVRYMELNYHKLLDDTPLEPFVKGLISL